MIGDMNRMRVAAGLATFFILALGPCVTHAAPASPAPSPVTAPAVQVSTKSMEGMVVEDLYRAEMSRDPFTRSPGASSISAVAAAASAVIKGPEEFSIHELTLKGIMKDRAGDFAILVSLRGTTYILKKNVLRGPKNKPVPGVMGKVFPAQKKVLLQTSDKDVQTLILGEDDKEGI